MNEKGDVMMLFTDMALTWDPEFRKWVELYARDFKALRADFGAAFEKLTELGCDRVLQGDSRL